MGKTPHPTPHTPHPTPCPQEKLFQQTLDRWFPSSKRCSNCGYIALENASGTRSGTESLPKVFLHDNCEQISLHKKRLSVDSYEEYYEITLKPEVTKQYQINIDDFKGMLLSPRSRKYLDGYATCSVWYSGMQSHMATKKILPNFR